MTRQAALIGIVLGIMALLACDRHPQVPTRVVPPQATPPGASANPGALGTDPSGRSIVGSYTLTLDLGSGCAALPEAERTRRYTAAIDDSGGGRYVVTLSDATFLTGPICTAGSGHLSGFGCHQFLASRDGDTVQFFLENDNADAHGGHIVEQSPSGTWVEIVGRAVGRLDRSSIEASGTSTVWYCGTPSSYPFPCSSFVSCDSTDMRMTLARK